MQQPKVFLPIIENREVICREFAQFVTRLAWERKVAGIKFWDQGRRPIWFMRQEMIAAFLKNDFTHLLFLDSDVVPQGTQFLDQLLAHNLPLVSGYYNDSDGFPINRKHGGKFLGKGVMEVDVFSMGMSLITREVLEKVPYPKPEPDIKPDADIEWCASVKQAKYKVMQDFNVRGLHFLPGIF